MKMQVVVLPIIIALNSQMIHADDRTVPSPTNNVAQASTNTEVKLKGILSATIVMHADQATIDKVEAIRVRMKVESVPEAVTVGPQTIQQAADYLGDRIAMAYPPGACVEHNGVFYFSGGTSTKCETNFVSGFAMKKGEPTIYRWEDESKPSGR